MDKKPLNLSAKRPAFFRRAVLTLGLILLLVMFSGKAIAGDPSGTQTGNASNVVNAQGTQIIMPVPKDSSDPVLMQQYQAFQEKAAREPLAVELADVIGLLQVAVNNSWVIICAIFIIFMQAGFSLVETGFTRAKNAAHTMLMNYLIYVIGTVGYWAVGFALMFGAFQVASLGGTPGLLPDKEFTIYLFGKAFGLFSYNGWFLGGNAYDIGVYTLFLFQLAFMDTAATIPTGALAERWTLRSFFVYGFYISAFLYPIFGNWAWGGGWLSQLGVNFSLGHGYVDFAGSGVVHAVGGMCALAGVIVLGPRLGRYDAEGRPTAMPGHNIPFGLLGVFILAIGWFAFNAGSTLGVAGAGLNRVGIIATTTLIAGAGGSFASAFYMIFRTGKPDPTMVANGLLAGLVAVTAASGFVGAASGFIIGTVAGILVCLSVEILDRMHIDDPVGAISVHGVCGIWGVLAVGLFADGTAYYSGSWNGVAGSVRGLFYGDAGQLIAQLIGIVTVVAWAFGVSLVFFRWLNSVVPMRVSPEVEIEGLDIEETGVLAYPDFPVGGRSSARPLRRNRSYTTSSYSRPM